MWGNRIGSGSPVLWDRLARVRQDLEPAATIPTEPDVILHSPGRAVVLIEAKFASANSTLRGKEERFESVEDFLVHYPPPERMADPLDRSWIEQQPPGEVLEQLCRNVVFAAWLADNGERPFVINLVRADDERDVEAQFRRHLSAKSPVAFRRLTWKAVYSSFACVGSASQPVPTISPTRQPTCAERSGSERRSPRSLIAMHRHRDLSLSETLSPWSPQWDRPSPWRGRAPRARLGRRRSALILAHAGNAPDASRTRTVSGRGGPRGLDPWR